MDFRSYLCLNRQLFHWFPVIAIFSIISFVHSLNEDSTAYSESGLSERRKIDWAHSPVDLLHLASLENDLYNEFGNTTTSENRKSFFKNSFGNGGYDEIQRWVQDYKESSLRAIENLGSKAEDPRRISTISSHPFLSLRMMKRFNRLSDTLNSERYMDRPVKESEFFQKIKPLASEVFLPNGTDVQNVMKSILELQFVYDFPSDELLEGKFGESATNFGPRLEDAYEIGLYAYRQRMFPQALDWLQTVYVKIKANPSSTELKSDAVFAAILEITKKHDELIEQINETNYYDLYHRFTHKIMSTNELQTLKESDTIRFLETKNMSLYPAYTLLCAGKDFVPETKRKNLRCWYERKSDLAWLINPLKMEVLSWDPYLLQIHDAIGSKVTEHMRLASLENMEPASTDNYYRGKNSIFVSNATTTFRTSFVAELYEQSEEDTRVLQAFERKVGRITQLGVNNLGDRDEPVREPLLISNYAFGGQFAPHLDTGDTNEGVDGNPAGGLLATFMFYLNNVQLGGYTVFPELGISVVPKKGSALFWYDHLQDGTPDHRTLHAGCPVIQGYKFIGTKSLNKVGMSAAAVVQQYRN